MTLTIIDPTSEEIRHLSMVQVKFSGVHIGGGIYLTADHFPAPGGSSNAVPQRGLDGAQASHPTTEYDFTMPADTSLWPDYLQDDDDPETADPVMIGYDMAMHVDERTGGDRYDGPAAPMLIMADQSDLLGASSSITGYPGTPPDGGASRSVPYETTGTILDYEEENVNDDIGRYWVIDGASVVGGMSGSGTWTGYTTPDGDIGDYLIGTVSSLYTSSDTISAGYGALSPDISSQYHDLAAAIEGLTGDDARSADDFARNVLMTGQSPGTAFNDMNGSFFHEDIWGNFNDNIMSGLGGDDRLYGMEGHDLLLGGEGDDTLEGGGGDDSLTGGAGSDLFRGFSATGTDYIADFDPNADIVDLSEYFATIDEVRAAAVPQPDGSLLIDLSQGTLPAALSGFVRLEATSLSSLTAANTMVLCFAAETPIMTVRGYRRAGDLAAGDLVISADHGPVPLVWVGRQRISEAQAAANPGQQAITIPADALGPGLPHRQIRLSPQHRVLTRGPVVQRMVGAPEVFIRAVDLLALPGINRAPESVEWIHLLCDAHEILDAAGLPAESLFPGPMARATVLGSAASAGLIGLLDLPEAEDTCRPVLSGARARQLVARQLKNRRPLVENPGIEV
ncbi:MAG: Hint domain-containing protein [Paracoccus sp. (in: a-proteobacteria)]